MSRHIVISIINFNGSTNTKECLKSLDSVSQEGFSLSVIVIDNASQEQFALTGMSLQIPIHIIHTKKNLGFSGGHNVGIKYAREQHADYIIILNNDTLVDQQFVKALYTIADSDETIGIVAPKIYFAKGFEYHKDRYGKEDLGKVIWYAGGKMDWENVIGHHRGVDEVDYGQYDKLEQTGFASGCCMMVRMSALAQIGYFDERYFLYYEDIDLNERMRKTKYTIYYVPEAVIWHKNAASAGGSGSPLQDYYISRNRMLLGFSYTSVHTKLALVRESMNILLTGRSWQRRGIRDFYLKKFGKGNFVTK